MSDDDQIARSWARDALAMAGHPRLVVAVRWSRRLTTTLGYACASTFAITLNERAWPLLTIDERRELVCHEVGHLVALHEGGDDAWGHGAAWRAVMARLGYPSAERCAEPEVAARLVALKKRPVRWHARCRCDDHLLTRRQVIMVVAGETIACDACGDPVELTGHVVTL